MPAKPVEALLGGVLDYAGMFPPARRTIADAIAMYARHRAGADAWILGTFVVSAERVEELDSAVGSMIDASGHGGAGRTDAWPVSVVLSTGSQNAVESMLREPRRTKIAAIEFHPVTPKQITALAAQVPDEVTAFFEVAPGANLDLSLDAIAASGASAKIRTGGLTAEVFPTESAIYRFFRACSERRIPAKATAGLHHALAGRYPLTYEAASTSAPMYGFLNVCTAAALIREGVAEIDVLPVLRESSPAAFRFDDAGLGWRDHCLSVDDLKATRATLFRSFGSCSVHEPIEELKRMRAL